MGILFVFKTTEKIRSACQRIKKTRHTAGSRFMMSESVQVTVGQ